MSDHIEFGLHDLPWQPLHSELQHVIRYYDGPQAGVLAQHGVLYLFQAIYDFPSGNGVWVYTRIDREEADALIAAGDIDVADGLIDQLGYGRAGQLAVVVGGRVALATETTGTDRDALMVSMRELAETMAEQSRGLDAISNVVSA